jgi:hypothetical protein
MNTIVGMATVAVVDKFKIGIFTPKQHRAPYFKAFVGDGKDISFSVTIDDLKVMFKIGASEKEINEVLKWAKTHQGELKAAWDQILKGQIPNRITSGVPSYISGLRVVAPLILEVDFATGTALVDFNKVSLFGPLKNFKDPKYFAQVHLVEGIPTWKDFDMDPDELWDIREPVHIASNLHS